MKLWSISIAYRLGLGFHALNNEGADGSNMMQPRRIDVGDLTYDGVSGEIIRRHILQNFVEICNAEQIETFPLSAGLHPDRGPIGIRMAARQLGHQTLTNENLHISARKAIESCAILDIGGFLAAFGADAPSDNSYALEQEYLRTHCATIGSASPLKRDTCFDVAWLISDEPQDFTVTQHSAYRDTAGLNSRYAQSIRSNTYGGVIRTDLHRIGTDDHWYLLNQNRNTIDEKKQLKRQKALIKAIVDFIASPTGAKTAAWAPHVFLTEGIILLTSARTAPFTSPIKVDLSSASSDRPVSHNERYRSDMGALKNGKDTWAWEFDDVRSLLKAGEEAREQLASTIEKEHG